MTDSDSLSSGVQSPSTRGTLVVVVLKARHLLTASSSRWTKQSPYATLTLFRERVQIDAPANKDARKPRRKHVVALDAIPPPDRAVAQAKWARATEKRALQRPLPTSPSSDKPLSSTPDDIMSIAESTATDTSSTASDDATDTKWHVRSLSTYPDKRGGQHPVWDAELRFPLESVPPASAESLGDAPEKLVLLVEVWAQIGLGRADRPLGTARLDVEPALEKGTMDAWVPISLGGSERGEVRLELTHYAGPPSHIRPHVPATPAPPAKTVPSALNSLLWRHGVPLRLPEWTFARGRVSVRVPALPAYVRVGAGKALRPVEWLGAVIGVSAAAGGFVARGFASVFGWSWAGARAD